MDSSQTSNTTAPFKLSPITWLALVVSLIVYPLIYCSGIMGSIVTPIIQDQSRPHWWMFWSANLAFHWIPFFLVYFALRYNGESFMSLGLDLSFFAKYKTWLVGLLVILVASSVLIPTFVYDGKLPAMSTTIFMAPISAPERLFVILGAFTAAFTEEIIFRGFALTRLSSWMKSPWIPLLISVASFVFIHGTPRNYGMAANYVFAGLAFGLPFIFMKMRRLEILILIHFMIDASLVLAP